MWQQHAVKSRELDSKLGKVCLKGAGTQVLLPRLMLYQVASVSPMQDIAEQTFTCTSQLSKNQKNGKTPVSAH